MGDVMIKMNDNGKMEVSFFLLSNHISGLNIFQDESLLGDYIDQLEKEYQHNGYATLIIHARYLRDDADDTLFMQHAWFDIVQPNRIGINDKVSPELLKKRVSDW